MSNSPTTKTKKEDKSHLESFPLFFEHTEDSRRILHNGKVVKYHLPRKQRTR